MRRAYANISISGELAGHNGINIPDEFKQKYYNSHMDIYYVCYSEFIDEKKESLTQFNARATGILLSKLYKNYSTCSYFQWKEITI